MIGNRLFLIEPFDTVAFRDGRPFEQNDQGLAETVGVFPPAPPAIAGAVRVAAAASLGIAAGCDWPKETEKLAASGDPADKERGQALTTLMDALVAGPFLVDRGSEEPVGLDDLFVPCPFSLLFAENSDSLRPVGRLVPAAARRVVYDIGGALEPRFFDGNACRTVPGVGAWVTMSWLRRYLNDPRRAPPESACRRIGEFARDETRIGIAVEKVTGRVKDGQLYAAAHHRPTAPREAAATRLAALLSPADGLPAAIDAVVPLGGEGRFARISAQPLAPQQDRGESLQASLDKLDGTRSGLALVALTPVPVDENCSLGVPLPPPLAALSPIAFAGPRPVAIGFTDQADPRRRRMRIVRAFPSGSTWYLPLPPGDAATAAVAALDAAGGIARLAPKDLAQLGFGAVIAGAWTRT